MVSALLKAIMAAKGLRQAHMAEVLGVSVDRVKSLTSGRVTKFTPEEARALVEKLHVRGDYLATGQPPIFKTAPEQEQDSRMELLREASEVSSSLGIERRYGELVRDVMFGVALKDGTLVTTTINNFVAETAGTYRAGQPTKKK